MKCVSTIAAATITARAVMTTMMKTKGNFMKLILAFALALPLQGCFFVWIPGSVISNLTGGEGSSAWDTCVPEATAYAGSTVTHTATGKLVTIEKVFGRSSRCQDSSRPILVQAKHE